MYVSLKEEDFFFFFAYTLTSQKQSHKDERESAGGHLSQWLLSRVPPPQSHTHLRFLSTRVRTVPQEPGPSINTEAGSWLANGGQEEHCFPSFSITPFVYTFLIAGRLVHDE